MTEKKTTEGGLTPGDIMQRMRTSGMPELDEAQAKFNELVDKVRWRIERPDHTLKGASELGALRAALLTEFNRISDVIMKLRGRNITDHHVLDGLSFDRMAAELDVSGNALAMWRNDDGPAFYVVIWRDAEGCVMDKVDPKRRTVEKRTAGGGAVVVPSRYRLDLLSDEELAQLDLGAWYEMLKDQATFGGER